MDSLWTKTAKLPHFGRLEKDIRVDVLVIGGGMAGLLCAYMLDRAGIDYALVEADEICSGITKDTTAKVTLQHGLIYHRLLEKYGLERAKQYLAANQETLDLYAVLCRDIDCDYTEKDAFVYSLDDRALIEKELAAYDRLGYPAEFADTLPLPFEVAGAVRVKKQAEIHPLKLAAGIAQGLRIYEHTRVRELAPHMARTDGGVVTAGQMIVATHFPLVNKHGSYFLKMYQHRSYVLALSGAPDVQGMYVDEDKKGLSFRNYQDLLLIGGGSHRTGKQGGCWEELERFAAQHYPDAKKVFCWATQDCMTLDGISYIGQYSRRTPGFYTATGFNKWGMSTSMAAARILTDLVSGKKSPCAEVFSPSRSIWHPQLAVNALEATANLLTISDRRCPHLGCALKWNAQERSWDCPCHGSRFTEQGRLIDNPATGNLR